MPREFSFTEMAVDEVMAEEGVWLAFPDAESDFEVKVAHHDRPAYDREILLARRHFSKEILVMLAEDEGLGDSDPRVDRKITSRALARGILLDWRVGGEEGPHVARTPEGDVPYSQDAAEQLLARFSSLYQFVLRHTTRLANFRAAVEEDDLGN